MPKRETQAVVEAFELMFPEAPNAQLARYVGRHVSTITRWRLYGEGGPTCDDMDRVDARLGEHIEACIQAQSGIRAARWRARLARPDRGEAPAVAAPKHPAPPDRGVSAVDSGTLAERQQAYLNAIR
jgi:hypothetical protein